MCRNVRSWIQTPTNDPYLRLMSKSTELWCWVLGDSPERVFSVSIERSAIIHDLKKAILREKPSFKDINADFLRWTNGKRWCTDINSW